MRWKISTCRHPLIKHPKVAQHLHHAVGAEWARHNKTVNAIGPRGVVFTEMTEDVMHCRSLRNSSTISVPCSAPDGKASLTESFYFWHQLPAVTGDIHRRRLVFGLNKAGGILVVREGPATLVCRSDSKSKCSAGLSRHRRHTAAVYLGSNLIETSLTSLSHPIMSATSSALIQGCWSIHSTS